MLKSLQKQNVCIVSCFQKKVDFKYTQTVDEFNMELTFFQRQKTVDNYSIMDEDNILNKVTSMGDVPGLADKSDDFAIFLIVSRKFSLRVCMFFI